jgi:hypothetical protein
MGGNKGHLPLETPGKNRGFSCKSRVMMDKIIGSSSIKYMCNLPKKKKIIIIIKQFCLQK